MSAQGPAASGLLRRVAGEQRLVQLGDQRASARPGAASWPVLRVDGPAALAELERWAAEEGALDLRLLLPSYGDARASAEELGFEPVHDDGELAELARPVPQELATRAQTRALGTRLAALVGAGDLVALSGPLGAGKTALAAGLGAALGVRGAVTSPTFVLARVHPGPVPLVHVDAYRLRDDAGRLSLDDLEDLELDARLEDSVTVVEWGSGMVEALSPDRLDVQLDRPAPQAPGSGPDDPGDSDDSPRIAWIRPRGRRWAQSGHRHVTDWIRGST